MAESHVQNEQGWESYMGIFDKNIESNRYFLRQRSLASFNMYSAWLWKLCQEKIQEIGQKNHIKARERYTSENIRMRLLNIYREVYESWISWKYCPSDELLTYDAYDIWKSGIGITFHKLWIKKQRGTGVLCKKSSLKSYLY